MAVLKPIQTGNDLNQISLFTTIPREFKLSFFFYPCGSLSRCMGYISY